MSQAAVGEKDGASASGSGSGSASDSALRLESVDVFNEGTCSVWHSAFRRPPPPRSTYHPMGLPKPAATATAAAAAAGAGAGGKEGKSKGGGGGKQTAAAAADAAGRASSSISGGKAAKGMGGGTTSTAAAATAAVGAATAATEHTHHHAIANANGGEAYLNPCTPAPARRQQAGQGQGLEVVGAKPWCVPQLALEDLGLDDKDAGARARRRRQKKKALAPQQQPPQELQSEAEDEVVEKESPPADEQREEQPPRAAAVEEAIQLRADWRPHPEGRPGASIHDQPPPAQDQEQPRHDAPPHPPLLVLPTSAQLLLVFVELALVGLVARGLAAGLRACARRHLPVRALLARAARKRPSGIGIGIGGAIRALKRLRSLTPRSMLASAVAAAGASMSAVFAGGSGAGAGAGGAGAEKPSAA